MQDASKKAIKEQWYDHLHEGQLEEDANVMGKVIKDLGLVKALSDTTFCDLICTTAKKFQDRNYDKLKKLLHEGG